MHAIKKCGSRHSCKWSQKSDNEINAAVILCGLMQADTQPLAPAPQANTVQANTIMSPPSIGLRCACSANKRCWAPDLDTDSESESEPEHDIGTQELFSPLLHNVCQCNPQAKCMHLYSFSSSQPSIQSHGRPQAGRPGTPKLYAIPSHDSDVAAHWQQPLVLAHQVDPVPGIDPAASIGTTVLQLEGTAGSSDSRLIRVVAAQPRSAEPKSGISWPRAKGGALEAAPDTARLSHPQPGQSSGSSGARKEQYKKARTKRREDSLGKCREAQELHSVLVQLMQQMATAALASQLHSMMVQFLSDIMSKVVVNVHHNPGDAAAGKAPLYTCNWAMLDSGSPPRGARHAAALSPRANFIELAEQLGLATSKHNRRKAAGSLWTRVVQHHQDMVWRLLAAVYRLVVARAAGQTVQPPESLWTEMGACVELAVLERNEYYAGRWTTGHFISHAFTGAGLVAALPAAPTPPCQAPSRGLPVPVPSANSDVLHLAPTLAVPPNVTAITV